MLLSTFLPISFFFSFLLFFLFRRNQTNNQSHSKEKFPPGPLKLPIIGSIHQLVGVNLHHKLYNLAKIYGPLLHIKLGEINSVVVSSPGLAYEVMKIQDLNFASRPKIAVSEALLYNSSDIGFAPYGSYWRELKKICTLELLSSNRVKSFASLREEEGNNLVQKILLTPQGTPVNLTKMLLSLTNTSITKAAFGKDCVHKWKFLNAMRKGIELASLFSLMDIFPSLGFLWKFSGLNLKMKRVHRELDSLLDDIIDEHLEKKAGGNGMETDLVDVLLKLKGITERENHFTMDNIKAVILGLFVAGTDTTATSIEWAMTELIRHPEAMRKAQQELRKSLKGGTKLEASHISEMQYLKQVIKETLRLHPPAPLLMPRICRETTKLSEYVISEGTQVIINAWAIGRDPKFWKDPESFQPERFERTEIDFKGTNFEFIPFGAGRRMCPGMAFGLAGVEFWLAQLLLHFDWELPNGRKPEELDISEASGVILTRKNDLCLLAFPHNSVI
ncbi:premnaspirodiene oxygenase-like [Dendrobium catenatum]|uniref:premnaspirodiene oxygenase-like n=1 Tax=Dendrobium catenatum TaxID=906689 RepID=UPI0009F4236C|nr:premnaspirodiene oxygenase-like [Dendrobium catenatum]